jgi:hypothetical protein
MCVVHFSVLLVLVGILEMVLLKMVTAEWKGVRNSSHFCIQENGISGHFSIALDKMRYGYRDWSSVVINYGENFWVFQILHFHGDPHPVLWTFGFSH